MHIRVGEPRQESSGAGGGRAAQPVVWTAVVDVDVGRWSSHVRLSCPAASQPPP